MEVTAALIPPLLPSRSFTRRKSLASPPHPRTKHHRSCWARARMELGSGSQS